MKQLVHVFYHIIFEMIGPRMFGIKLCREFTFLKDIYPVFLTHQKLCPKFHQQRINLVFIGNRFISIDSVIVTFNGFDKHGEILGV